MTAIGRGRKPKPTKLKQLQGNAGKRKLNTNEPQFEQITDVTDIEPPDYLSELAAVMWRRVVGQLLANKLLTLADMHNVEAFCMAYGRWRDAQRLIDEHGVVIINPATGQMSKNPAATVVNEAAKQMIQFGSLLGLDPSSRTRLTGGVRETSVNPFMDL